MKLKAFHSYQELYDLTIGKGWPKGHGDNAYPAFTVLGATPPIDSRCIIANVVQYNDGDLFFLEYSTANEGLWRKSINNSTFSTYFQAGGGIFSFQTTTKNKFKSTSFYNKYESRKEVA